MNKFTNLILKYTNLDITDSLDEILKEINNISIDDVLFHYEDLFKIFFNSEFHKNFFLITTNNILKIRNSLNINSIKKINESKYIEGILNEKDQIGFTEKGQNCLDSSINGVSNPEWDSLMLYAVSWFRIAKNHCFKNRNKRTAFVSVKSTLIIDMIHNLLQYDFNFLDLKIYKDLFFEERKKFLILEEDKIVNLWTGRTISEDYILSLLIVNFKDVNNEERDKIYKILYLNLVIFLSLNRISVNLNLRKFKKELIYKFKEKNININNLLFT